MYYFCLHLIDNGGDMQKTMLIFVRSLLRGLGLVSLILTGTLTLSVLALTPFSPKRIFSVGKHMFHSAKHLTELPKIYLLAIREMEGPIWIGILGFPFVLLMLLLDDWAE